MRHDIVEQPAAETFAAVNAADFVALAFGPALDLVALSLHFALIELVVRTGRGERRQTHRNRAAEHLGHTGHHHHRWCNECACNARGDSERGHQAVVQPEHHVAHTCTARGMNLLRVMIVFALQDRERHEIYPLRVMD